jgi:uncharacterized linocin/CFP29 family protein
MSNGNNNDENWPTRSYDDPLWKEINDAVLKEMGKVRIAQMVFPSTVLSGDPTQVINDEIEFSDFPIPTRGNTEPDNLTLNRPPLTIPEGRTKGFEEIYRGFALSGAQVSRERETKTAMTLARMVAKEVALAEDIIIFQGKDGALPTDVEVDRNLEVAGDKGGLLGAAMHAIEVPRLPKASGKSSPVYGGNTFKAVAEGIAHLTAVGQARPYALILPSGVYADTYAPIGDSLVTTADRIKPMMEGGFYGTATLPDSSDDQDGKGLLAALGGEPTSVYIGREAQAEFLQQEKSKYLFRVVERVQFVARDPRALVRLEFKF